MKKNWNQILESAQPVVDFLSSDSFFSRPYDGDREKFIETFAKKPSSRKPKSQTQFFGCFRFKYPPILPKYPLNPPRTPHNQASGPPFRRQQAHLAC